MELASARRLRLENERLVAEVARLRRLLLSGAARGEVGAEDAAMEEEARFVALEMELQHAKEALQALKADRKRLKAEKFDLLNQMKALYGTLEDKERELRDFIRNYEQVSHHDIRITLVTVDIHVTLITNSPYTFERFLQQPGRCERLRKAP